MAAPRRAAPVRDEVLSDYLKRSREAAGLSQDALVRRTGLSLSTIRKMEDGRTNNPGIFTLIKVWQELGLAPDGLVKVREGGSKPRSTTAAR